MKKSAFFIFIFVLPFFVCASGCKRIERITGRIEFFGNAPFESPGFITEDNRIFSLEVEKNSRFTVKEITELYGNKIELKGYSVLEKDNGKNLKDGEFIIKNYKIIKSNKK